MARSLLVENLLPQNVVDTECVSTTCSNLQKQPNGELLVAVDHNQLWTMASETVDPIDWSHPPPYTGQYPLSSSYCTLQCGLQITRLVALSQSRTCYRRNARPTIIYNCLCAHSGYVYIYIYKRKDIFILIYIRNIYILIHIRNIYILIYIRNIYFQQRIIFVGNYKGSSNAFHEHKQQQ